MKKHKTKLNNNRQQLIKVYKKVVEKLKSANVLSKKSF